MQIPCSVRIDVTLGTGPGELNGSIVLTAENGDVIEKTEPVKLVAGKSLMAGPLLAHFELQGALSPEPVPTPAPPPKLAPGTAGKPGTAAAAAGRR